MKPRPPPGLTLCRQRRDPESEPQTSLGYADCQTLVLVLTFLTYALYHAARKPPSIVKSSLVGTLYLGPHSVNGTPAVSPAPSPAEAMGVPRGNAVFSDEDAGATGGEVKTRKSSASVLKAQREARVGWAPFQGLQGLGLLGEVDMSFLASYAIAMFFFGQVGDRVDLRLLLSLGMFLTSVFTALYGLAYFLNIHSTPFFLLTASLAGLFQATGWPCVVAIMANWYGHKGRGLVFGIWNSHTSLGNIMGALVASAALEDGWGWSYIMPAAAMAVGAVAVYLFLPSSPGSIGLQALAPNEAGEEDLQGAGLRGSGCQQLVHHRDAADQSELEPFAGKGIGSSQPGEGDPGAGTSADVSTYDDDTAGLLEEMELGGLSRRGRSRRRSSNPDDAPAIGFLEAWKIPGVMAFAFCLFFAKLVAYTFLYWLPFYISRTVIEGHHMTQEEAGVTSTVFDIGGVLGGIVAGHLSDALRARAAVTAAFLALVAPALAAYVFFGGANLWANVCLLAVVGFLVNGPYALITCAVSADLGQHRSLEGNARALATVTAIIDGTGSIGAAVGPFLTGLVSEAGGTLGWAMVFVMLCVSTVAALFCILHIALQELHAISDLWYSSRTNATPGGKQVTIGAGTT